jgi:DNA end-binding protein Ku
MAAPRAYWKGHVRLALVSFPVRLYAAVTSTERISLNRIHRETGERVRMQNVVPDEGPVDKDDIVMGYEYERGRYVPVEDEELEALDIESKHTIDLTRFVDLSDIDPIYFDRPYFIAPDGDIATEAFVTIRDALKRAKKVALGQIVLSKRERIVAIQPCGRGLVLETLRWADEVREADAYFEGIEDVEVSEDQVQMAEQLIEARSGAFEPETFVDRYQEALRALIQEKLKGKETMKPTKPQKAQGDNVVNLMDALKASLDDGEGGKKSSGSTARRSRASGSSASKSSSSKSSGSKASSKSSASKSSASKASGSKASSASQKSGASSSGGKQKKSA